MNKKDYKNTKSGDYPLFYGEKTAATKWYAEDEKGTKRWDEAKVAHFWQRLRKVKMQQRDYDFSEFIFPEFKAPHFWLEKEQHIFKDTVTFMWSKFRGEADFDGVEFADEVGFTRTVFNGNGIFYGTQFKDQAFFNMTQFKGKAYFVDTQFNGFTTFFGARFTSLVEFHESLFTSNTSFWYTHFMGRADFGSAKFTSETDFRYTEFTNVASFRSARFQGKLFFEEVYGAPTAHIIFKRTNFATEAQQFFKALHTTPKPQAPSPWAKCKTWVKQLRDKGTTNATTTKVDLIRPTLIFEECLLTKQVIFLDFDFSLVQFKKTDLIDAKISNCVFGRGKRTNRVEFSNQKASKVILEAMQNDKIEILQRLKEQDFSNKESELRAAETIELTGESNPSGEEKTEIEEGGQTQLENHSKNRETSFDKAVKKLHHKGYKKHLKREHYEMMGETYRQLKTNQINAKNWAVAGDAYRSEMYMRRKVLHLDFLINPRKVHLLAALLVVTLHDLWSGFQQSVARPLIWLVLVWFLFGFGYALHAVGTNLGVEGFEALEHMRCSRFMALQGLLESFYALFPLSGKIDASALGISKWVMVFERILGVTLITFFVLTIRARYKQ